MSNSVTVYLSRKNLTTLLTKLDRNKVEVGSSYCTLVKSDTVHKQYPITGTQQVVVVAVEDEDYYTDREAGVTYEDYHVGT